MKKVILGFAMVVSTIASARSVQPLEPIFVKALELHGDFMPGPGFIPRNPLTLIKAQVPSNGCTSAESFKVVSKDILGGKLLSIVRVKPDLCRAFFPEGTEVELTTEVVGFGQTVAFANPIRIDDQTTH